MADAMSHERITSLKRVKAGHAGEITKITGFLDALLRDKRNCKEVQVYKERLVEQWGRYWRVFDELIQLIPHESDDYTKENDHHNRRCQVYQLYMAEIEQFLSRDEEEKRTEDGDATKLTEGSKAVDAVIRSTRVQDEERSESSQSSRRTSLSSKGREEARLDKILAEKKLELFKNAKERKLREQCLKLDNEIAEAEDEVDLARTKEQLFEQFEEILLDDLDVKSKVDKSPPIVTTDERVPDLTRNVKASTEIKPQLPSTDGFRDPPPVPSSLRNPFTERKPFTNAMYGRRAERHPVTPVRLWESFLPYHYDLSPSPLSEVNRETLSPPLSVNRNREKLESRVHFEPGHSPQRRTDQSGRTLTKLTSSLNSIVTRTNLPPLEVVKFTGDPGKYFQFKSRFDEMVLTQDLTESQQMSRLLQFLDGPARIAVADFEGTPSGLYKAMRLLENRYGQPHIVTKACVDAMVDGPTIANNDRVGLREFADRARTLYETLSSINALDEMNMTNIAQMSRKLAITHQVKWRENVQRIREQKRNPNLLDLVEFIERRAEVVNDPIFGHVGEAQRTFPSTFLRKVDRYPVKKDKERISTMAAQFWTGMTNESKRNLKDKYTQYEVDGGLVKSGGERKAKCVVCEGLHQLNDCSVFKTKSIRQRNIIVRTHRLCLNCLNVGHFVFHCKSKLRCLSCRRKHHSLLHKDVAADQEIPAGLKTRIETNNSTDKESSKAS